MSVRTIYSKVRPGRALHAIADALAPGSGRTDVSTPEQFLQASVVPLRSGRVVAPHTHAPRRDLSCPPVTQESWVVIRGKIRVRLFDIDHSPLDEQVLSAGCLLVTYDGGHSLECIEEDTVMLEFKNGPYEGGVVQPFSPAVP